LGSKFLFVNKRWLVTLLQYLSATCNLQPPAPSFVGNLGNNFDVNSPAEVCKPTSSNKQTQSTEHILK
jgi:hypothetical protein